MNKFISTTLCCILMIFFLFVDYCQAQEPDINRFLKSYKNQYNLVLEARSLYDFNPEYFQLDDVKKYLEHLDGGYIYVGENADSIEVDIDEFSYTINHIEKDSLETKYFMNRAESNSGLQHHLALLFYAYDDSAELLHCWVVNQSGVHTYGSSQISRNDLISLEYKFYQHLKKQSNSTVNRGVFQIDEEEDTLTENIESRLAEVLFPNFVDSALLHYNTLLVSPVLNLGTLPWYCLKAFPESTHQLIDMFNIQILESINHMSIVSRLDIKDGAPMNKYSYRYRSDILDPITTVVGNPRYGACDMPDLKGAEAEAELVAKKFKTTVLSDHSATRQNIFKNERMDADLLYIASHAESSSTAPMDSSFIYLSSKDNECNRLTAKEILYLPKKQNSLIVMSACESGKGRTVTGGVVGLARSFLINGKSDAYGNEFYGARNVIMSLWNIEDQSTYELMTLFLEELEHPQTYFPVSPLRQAMLRYREIDPDPLHWGAFQSMGLCFPGTVLMWIE